MGSFAKVENKIVTDVIGADQEFIDSGAVGKSSDWVETSKTGELRKQYARIGGTYDKANDVFINASPNPSWTLDASFDWQPPTAKPNLSSKDKADGKDHIWNEETKAWDAFTILTG